MTTIAITAETVNGPMFGIRARRESLGVSRLDLAIRAECSMTHLAQIEGGLLPHRSAVLPRVVAALEQLENG